ncbi:MAG: cytochrome bc complex cytochrome b subunit [Myxococcales bacterium]
MRAPGEMPPPRKGLYGFIDRRYGITPLVEFLAHKEVPIGGHSMVWYYLGGITLFFFAIQLASGVLLLAYYQPGEATSYESIRFLTTKVPFGWLVRSMHCWSAHLMIISLITHMLSTMVLKAYRTPRELTWVTGFVLFALALGFGFSGYLLPWNELAFFATAVGTDSMKAVPGIGEWLLQVMRGGTDVSINTLYRFFALHVVVLPLFTVCVVTGHLLFVQRQGMAAPMAHDKPARGMKFFPDFALRDLLLWLVCLIALASLAVFLPYGPGIPGMEWELGKKANPLAPAYPGIKPEWYFLWVYQLLKEFPAHLFGMEGSQAAIAVVSVLFGIWALVPWLDRNARASRPSPAFTDLAMAALIFLAYLMLKAWDIGGGEAVLPDPRAVARTCAYWGLLFAAVTVAVRLALRSAPYFDFTAAAALQIALHGFVGLSYLAAGAISVLLLAATLAFRIVRSRNAVAVGSQP